MAYKYFNVNINQYVAHVEINRADKMNSFFEASVICYTWTPRRKRTIN